MLPHEFPPWGTVGSQFHRLQKSGRWERIHNVLHGRAATRTEGLRPTVGIIDCQSVKTTEVGGERGYDAGKKVTGRKLDTLGFLIACVVHPANIRDHDGCEFVLDKVKQRFVR